MSTISASVINGTDGRFEYREYNTILNKLIYDTENKGYKIQSIGSCLGMSDEATRALEKWGNNQQTRSRLVGLKRHFGDGVIYRVNQVTKAKQKQQQRLPPFVIGAYVNEAAIDVFAGEIDVDYHVKHILRANELVEITESAENQDDDVSVTSAIAPPSKEITKTLDNTDELIRRLRRTEHKLDDIQNALGCKRGRQNNNKGQQKKQNKRFDKRRYDEDRSKNDKEKTSNAKRSWHEDSQDEEEE